MVEQAARRRRPDPLLLAVDGPSGAGTSTLGRAVTERLAATLVCGDDFYADLPEAERWSLTAEQGLERYFDWRRLREQALLPLAHRQPASYRPFDWRMGAGLAEDEVVLPPADVVVVEGVYTARPELRDLYGLTVLVRTPADVRRSRLVARGHHNQHWWSRWDAAERLYFATVCTPDAVDLVVPGT